MKLQILILALITATVSVGAQVQTFIGLDKEEVEKIMREEYKKFALDNTVKKQQFNYFKFVNNNETITWIIFFSDNDVCTSTKKVCDYIEYDYVLKELNEKYKKVKNLSWEYQAGEKTISVTIEEKDWYFTVREKQIKR